MCRMNRLHLFAWILRVDRTTTTILTRPDPGRELRTEGGERPEEGIRELVERGG